MQSPCRLLSVLLAGLSLIAVPAVQAGTSCTVKFGVPENVDLSALEVDVAYGTSGGVFIGLGESASCSSAFGINSFYDDDALQELHFSIADISSFDAPGYVATCNFGTITPVVPENIIVTVVDNLNNTDDGLFGSKVCGSPYSGSTPPHARDALTILRRSIMLNSCPNCECDVDNSGTPTATDALNVLRASAEVPGLVFNCGPPCVGSPSGTGPAASVNVNAQVICNGVGCGNGMIETGEDCDDGNADNSDGCTSECDAPCPETPRLDCRAAGSSKLLIKGDGSGDKDKLVWSWLKGGEIGLDDVSNPLSEAPFRLCLYPNGNLLEEITLQDEGWVTLGEKGYKLSDKTAVNGISGVQIGTGIEGKSKLKLKGSGANLPLMLLPATTWTIQLNDVQKGECWSSTFPTATVSEPTLFKAKNP